MATSLRLKINCVILSAFENYKEKIKINICQCCCYVIWAICLLRPADRGLAPEKSLPPTFRNGDFKVDLILTALFVCLHILKSFVEKSYVRFLSVDPQQPSFKRAADISKY